jgi:hypothetical protein
MNNIYSTLLLIFGFVSGMSIMYIWCKYGNPDER